MGYQPVKMLAYEVPTHEMPVHKGPAYGMPAYKDACL
jgi:hypothetical protein